MAAGSSASNGGGSLEERLVEVALRVACGHGRHVAAAVASAAIAAVRRPALPAPRGTEAERGLGPEESQEAAVVARVKAVEAALRAQRLLGGQPTLAEGIGRLRLVKAAANAAKHQRREPNSAEFASRTFAYEEDTAEVRSRVEGDVDGIVGCGDVPSVPYGVGDLTCVREEASEDKCRSEAIEIGMGTPCSACTPSPGASLRVSPSFPPLLPLPPFPQLILPQFVAAVDGPGEELMLVSTRPEGAGAEDGELTSEVMHDAAAPSEELQGDREFVHKTAVGSEGSGAKNEGGVNEKSEKAVQECKGTEFDDKEKLVWEVAKRSGKKRRTPKRYLLAEQLQALLAGAVKVGHSARLVEALRQDGCSERDLEEATSAIEDTR